MDLDADGKIDILSGSYSWDEAPMAGTFHLLRGVEGGGFAPPVTVNGTDGKPLIMDFGDRANESDPDLDRICTRAFAVDLNGDGHLDIVSGNFGGTFGAFMGTGKGEFSPATTPLTGKDGDLLRVDGMHSDPFFCDFDGDGDMDMLSSSTSAGVYLYPNVGSKTEFAFGEMRTLVEPFDGEPYQEVTKLGTGHITRPQYGSRVTAADVTGDGKLDLIVGDQLTYMLAKEGLSEDEVLAKLAAWEKKNAEHMKTYPQIEDFENMTDEEEAAMEAFYEGMEALREEKAEFVDERTTGFVWLYAQA